MFSPPPTLRISAARSRRRGTSGCNERVPPKRRRALPCRASWLPDVVCTVQQAAPFARNATSAAASERKCRPGRGRSHHRRLQALSHQATTALITRARRGNRSVFRTHILAYPMRARNQRSPRRTHAFITRRAPPRCEDKASGCTRRFTYSRLKGTIRLFIAVKKKKKTKKKTSLESGGNHRK